MSEYPLKIVTPDHLAFDDMAQELIVRTVTGDVCILAGHTDYMTPLAKGKIKVKKNGEWCVASCMGGTLVLIGGEVTVIAESFAWSDESSQKKNT